MMNTIGLHAVVNGKVVMASEAVVPVTRREVQYGFSVYEALRIIKGHAVHLEDHIRRLNNSCRGIGLVHSITEEDFVAWVGLLIEADDIDDATVRILLVGGQPSICCITAAPLLTYPDSYYDGGICTITYEGERFLPACKTSNLLLNYLALRKANEAGAFEALLVDRHGRILEGTRSNFFAFSKADGTLHTAADELVLEGITRDRILKAAALDGIDVVFEPPRLSDIHAGKYDELFISSTSMGAMPVRKVDDLLFSDPFDRTQAICRRIRSWELDD
ncbi:MAG: aminotransferase class IV [Sphaerochaetaceae bacterium]|jgi:branched-chain amino acid aminotransferase